MWAVSRLMSHHVTSIPTSNIPRFINAPPAGLARASGTWVSFWLSPFFSLQADANHYNCSKSWSRWLNHPPYQLIGTIPQYPTRTWHVWDHQPGIVNLYVGISFFGSHLCQWLQNPRTYGILIDFLQGPQLLCKMLLPPSTQWADLAICGIVAVLALRARSLHWLLLKKSTFH